MRRVLIGLCVAAVVLLVVGFVFRSRTATPPAVVEHAERASQGDQPLFAQRKGPPTAQVLATAPERTVRDKKRRDELRARIYRAFGQALPVEGDAATGIAPNQPKLGKKYVQNRIRDDFVPLAKECYEAALERSPELSGTMVLELTIVGDQSVGGVVDSVRLAEESNLADPELSECMRQSMMSMSFVPPETGGVTTVRYPFVMNQSDAGTQG